MFWGLIQYHSRRLSDLTFQKETKGTAGPFPSGWSTDIYLCSK